MESSKKPSSQGSENFGVGIGPPASAHHHSQRYMSAADQTFHTPNFGDEEFDIPPIALPPHHPQHPQQQHSSEQQQQHQQQHEQNMWVSHPHHYASMYMAEQMTHQQPYSSSPPTYTQLSSPHSQQSPHRSNPHLLSSMDHHSQQQQQHQFGRPPHMGNGNMTGNNGIGGGGGPPGRSPTNSNSSNQEVASEDSSNDSGNVMAQRNSSMKRPSPEPIIIDTSLRSSQQHAGGGGGGGGGGPGGGGGGVGAPKKVKAQKKKKKRDPNEPQKPVSAYALFFRDTQAAIKGQNPNASFGDVSKTVASLWDALEVDNKNVYKKKTEIAKKEYLKALAAYRASLVSKGAPTDSAEGMYPPNFNATMNSAQSTYASQNHYGSSGAGGGGGGGQKKGPTGGTHHQSRSGGGGGPGRSPPNNSIGVGQHVVSSQGIGDASQYGVMRHGAPYMNQLGDVRHGIGMSNVIHMQGGGGGGGNGIGHGQPGLSPYDTHHGVGGGVAGNGGPMCIRNGCTTNAMTSQEWDEEYSSPDCVVTHCRDAFTNWVSSNQSTNPSYHPAANFSVPGTNCPDLITHFT